MANRRMEAVGYRKFQVQPQLAEGLLAVARPGGELMQAVASAFFRLADEAGAVADRQAQRRGRLAGQQAAIAGAPQIDVDVAGGDHRAIAASILRKEEGFRETPYWDVNAFRTGYGSDTITRADGSVVKVGKGMRITRDDAERDLARRIPEFEGRAVAQVGAENWNRLPPNVRGALLSVAYNYGSLPPSVRAAVRGGDVEQIAGAVESLSANRTRRENEAAIIRGGAVPGRDATFTATGGFRPTGQATIYGEAFDEAGARTYLQMLDTEMLSTTSQVYELYKDDPVALEKALGALKSEIGREHVFPEIAGDFEVAYGRLALRYMEQGRKRLQDRLEAADRAEFVERTDTLTTDIARKIAGMDPDDPAAAELLATTQQELDRHYDAAADRGILAPDAAATAKAKARAATAVAFYARQAEARSAEEIAALREKMRADFAAGELDGVDADAWAGLEAELTRMEAAKLREEQARAGELADRTQRQIARVEAGFEPEPEELNRLTLDQNGTPDGPRIVETGRRMLDAAGRLRDLPLPAAREYVAGLREKIGPSTGSGDASDADIAVLAYAETRLAELEELAAKDPVGYEIATGRLELTPIALAGSDEELAASLAARRAEMAGVAETYRTPLEILRPAERSALARMIAEEPAQLPRLARALRGALGTDARTALAEISQDAPALAHAAGVSLATGDDAFVEEIALTLSAKAKGEYRLKMPAAEKFAASAPPAFAAALAFQGGARTAVLQTAQLVFEREANLLGFDPAELGKEGTAATLAWRRALERALGARQTGGRQTGGLGEVNGAAIVVPAGMDVDEPQRLLSGLTDEQLQQLPAIRTANEVPVTAAQIRSATLVTAGDGRYRVALGDPLGYEPRWVLGADGDFWTLDLKALQRLAGDAGGGWSRNQGRTGWGSSP